MSIYSELAALEVEGVVAWGQNGKLKYVADAELTAAMKSRLLGVKTETVAAWDRSRTLPFELNGLQQAYWLGENDAFVESTPAFLHLIFAADFPEEAAMQAALVRLIERHPPLAYSLSADMPVFSSTDVAQPRIECVQAQRRHAASSCDALDMDAPLLGKFGTGAPLFRLIMVDDGDQTCLHGIFRLALFDAYSITLMVEELMLLARGHTLDPIEGAYDLDSFRAFEFRHKRQRLRDRSFWTEQVKMLPGPANNLLTARRFPHMRTPRRFVEHREALNAATYDELKSRAQAHGVSVNAVLVTCYLSTLSRWNEARPCCASVMYSQRLIMPEQHVACIGNFGNLLLLGAPDQQAAFADQARQIQADLFEAMAHSAYDGVSVIRDWAALHDASAQAGDPPMPFVFSTQIGNSLRDPVIDQIGHRMMTPQVWIDAQAFEQDGDLILSFDELEGRLPDGMASDMFAYFSAWVRALATDDAAWSGSAHDLPATTLDLIAQVNATDHPHPPTTLVENIFRLAIENPERVAFWHHAGNLTFGALLSRASKLAQYLCENGVGPGDNVVVSGQRGPDLMVAVYAVMLASGTYVPVTPDMPTERVKKIIGTSAATTILADDDKRIAAILSSPVVWTGNYRTFLDTVEEDEIIEPTYPIDPQQLAYIIFTSGSTGAPKGVAITHEAAANTLLSCTRVFGLDTADRILAPSEVTFDLSVFDAFLPAIVGCSTILPETSDLNDPAHWVAAASRFEATVWNSVPAILEMAVTYAQDGVSDLRLPESLRLVMVSGDWVPLGLPGALRRAVPSCAFAALGGATEASIWSNYFMVGDVDSTWRSIPYGKPLDNQRFFILDRHQNLCPRGVTGQLHIAGTGLATGYFNDGTQTTERFFVHAVLGQRLYKTGDLARYLPSGDIEFLGREDFQVQINGFRVELSEIEKVAQDCPAVDRAVALYSGQCTGGLQLAYVPAGSGADNTALVQRHLEAHLSHYMVPDRLHMIDDLPLTANGKIDRKRLQSMVVVDAQLTVPREQEAGGIRSGSLRLLDCVQVVLPSITGVHQNWFASGCNSLEALRVLERLNQTLGLKLQLADIYQTQTVDALARLIEGEAQGTGNTVWLNRTAAGADQLVVFVHPVGGSIGCYVEAGYALRDSHDVVALCAEEDDGPLGIPGLAARYLEQIASSLASYRTIVFAGWSLGGSVAMEMARAAHARGVTGLGVVTIDSFVGGVRELLNDAQLFDLFLADMQGFQTLGVNATPATPAALDAVLAQRFHIFAHNYAALAAYVPADPEFPVVSFAATDQAPMPGLRPMSKVLPTLDITLLSGDHYSILEQPACEAWIQAIRQPRILVAKTSSELGQT